VTNEDPTPSNYPKQLPDPKQLPHHECLVSHARQPSEVFSQVVLELPNIASYTDRLILNSFILTTIFSVIS